VHPAVSDAAVKHEVRTSVVAGPLAFGKLRWAFSQMKSKMSWVVLHHMLIVPYRPTGPISVGQAVQAEGREQVEVWLYRGLWLVFVSREECKSQPEVAVCYCDTRKVKKRYRKQKTSGTRGE
jgi:hypothetical protein